MLSAMKPLGDQNSKERTRVRLRWLAAATFDMAGAGHFAMPDVFERIEPPQ